jgi:hypothetical protein
MSVDKTFGRNSRRGNTNCQNDEENLFHPTHMHTNSIEKYIFLRKGSG